MGEWWEQPYRRGKPADLPGFPMAMYPPDSEAKGHKPTPGAAEVLAYKRIVARLGRWKWDPDGWDEAYSNAFAHGAGPNVAESGIAGVQRQAELEPSGWLDEKTFEVLRSVEVPAGLPHAGELAIDGPAVQLLREAYEAYKRARIAGPADVEVTATEGEPHWGGAGDVMTQFVEPFMVERGLPIGSGKRTPAHNAAIGGSATSDHLTTKSTTAARDFPTFSGEDDAHALAAALGCETWKANSYDGFTFAAGGRSWRAQVLWGAAIDHADHVHVGISPA